MVTYLLADGRRVTLPLTSFTREIALRASWLLHHLKIPNIDLSFIYDLRPAAEMPVTAVAEAIEVLAARHQRSLQPVEKLGGGWTGSRLDGGVHGGCA